MLTSKPHQFVDFNNNAKVSVNIIQSDKVRYLEVAANDVILRQHLSEDETRSTAHQTDVVTRIVLYSTTLQLIKFIKTKSLIASWSYDCLILT